MAIKLKKNRKGDLYIPIESFSKYYDTNKLAYYNIEVKDGVLHFTAYDDNKVTIPPTVKTVTYIDLPSGWLWGFPRVLPDPKPSDMRAWVISEGYPEKDVDFALKYCRMWYGEEE